MDLLNVKSSLIFFLIILINLIIIYYRNNLAKLLNIYDHPNDRKIHKIPTPLVGGLCCFITISASTALIFFQSLIPLNKLIIYLLF